jgi:hypothetical protein
MAKFGPGTLTIGETGTSVDCSCLVNSMQITTNVDEGDDSTKLCGTVVPGTRTYTYTLTGNVDTDEEAGAAGLFALSQDADGTTASGKVIINPLDFGSDGAYGDVMASDLEWKLVGKPEYVYGTGGAVLEADEAELVGAA